MEAVGKQRSKNDYDKIVEEIPFLFTRDEMKIISYLSEKEFVEMKRNNDGVQKETFSFVRHLSGTVRSSEVYHNSICNSIEAALNIKLRE